MALFDSNDAYQDVVAAVAFIQMGIAHANYFLAIIKDTGMRRQCAGADREQSDRCHGVLSLPALVGL